jgi:branched-chain amino acid aminotransferase
MPSFDIVELQGCIKKLVQIDRDWFPRTDPDFPYPGHMYIRLCHFSTDEMIGVKSPAKTKIIGFLNPCTIKTRQLKVKCIQDVIKNWAMGHGEFRISGNFGPLLPTVTDAKINGFDDVLWMIDDYVQEMTILNVFFLI